MDTIQTIEDVMTNLRVFHAYATSPDPTEQTFYHNLLRRGNNFVVAELNGQVFFGPSRFIGYTNNTIHHHTDDESGVDGRETNRAVDRLFGAHHPSQLCEYAYQARCAELGLTAAGRVREYWFYRIEER